MGATFALAVPEVLLLHQFTLCSPLGKQLKRCLFQLSSLIFFPPDQLLSSLCSEERDTRHLRCLYYVATERGRAEGHGTQVQIPGVLLPLAKPQLSHL